MRNLSCLTALLAISTAMPALAQDSQATPPTAFSNPCSAAPFTDWDFWVGDWIAFDFDTGIVQGDDRVEKVNNGCVILQDWSQMTDRFRTPGAEFRYAGISFSTVVGTADRPVWRQTWIGNTGGAITLTGGLNDDGTMVIKSTEFPIQNGQFAKRIWYWDPEEDGSVHSWGEIYTRDADSEFAEEPATLPWNLRYVSRHAISPLVEQASAE